jgi:hypothetical protein
MDKNVTQTILLIADEPIVKNLRRNLSAKAAKTEKSRKMTVKRKRRQEFKKE